MPGDFNDVIEKALAVIEDLRMSGATNFKDERYAGQRGVDRADALYKAYQKVKALTRPEPDRSEARERIAETLSSCRDYLQDIVGGATVSDRSIVNAIALVDEIDAILSAGLVPDEAAIRAEGRVSIPNDILMQARCPSDARQTIGECSNCGCSIGLYAIRNGGQK